MTRLRPILAGACSLLVLGACAAEQASPGYTSTQGLAGPCPATTAATAPVGSAGVVTPCTCAAVSPDANDAGAASLEAAATATSDASPVQADGAIDPAALLSLLGSTTRTDPNPVLCPSSFSCVGFDGVPTCVAQGALAPPACQSNADCAAAGLPATPCVTLSIDIAGAVSFPLPVCLKLCNAG